MEKSIARHKNLAIEHSEEAGNRREELVLEHLCPECGGPLTPDLNEVVCRKCGVIVTENPDQSGPEAKQISTLSHNEKVWQEINKLNLRIEHLHAQIIGAEELECRRCGRPVVWIRGRKNRGRKPEYCVECRPIMAKLRVKEWMKGIPEEKKVELQKKSKISMRNLRLSRKLRLERDLTKAKDLRDLAKFTKPEDEHS